MLKSDSAIERRTEWAPKVGRQSSGFHLTGLVYCAMTFFMGLAAIQGGANLLYGVFGLMVGLFLMAGVLRRIMLRGLILRRELPELYKVNEPVSLLYHFTNKKRFLPSFALSLLECEPGLPFEIPPQTYCLLVPPKQTQVAGISLTPIRRGKYLLNRYQIYSSFPFGFYRKVTSRQDPVELVVAPATGRVSDRLIAMCRSAEKSGTPVKPRRGGNDEFYGVREFRQGESPRRIYWRRSARTPGTLVTKEMTQVSPPRLFLMVDTYAPATLEGGRIEDAEALTAVEEALAMAASLANRGQIDGLAVGCCVWSGNDFSTIAVQRGRRQLNDILMLLAGAPRNSKADATALLNASHGRIDSQCTGILISGSELQQNLADQSRGSLVLLSAGSALARSSFTFEESVDFSKHMPESHFSPAAG